MPARSKVFWLLLPALATALCLTAACRKAKAVRWQEKSVASLELFEKGRYQEALPLAGEAARMAEESFGPEDIRTAYALDFLGKVRRRLGELEPAQGLFERAVEISGKVLGPDAPKRAHFLDNLAELLMTQGKYDEAEGAYQDSLRLMQRNFGELSAPVAAAYAHLAELYTRWGVYEEADPLIRRLDDISSRVGARDDGVLASVAADRCAIFLRWGEMQRAREACVDALSLRRRLPKNHLDLAQALSGAGLLELREGRADEAAQTIGRALDIYRASPEADRQALVDGWLAMAEVYAAQGRDREAEELFTKLLPQYSNPYAMVKAALRAAGHYQRRGRLDIAEGLYLQALAKQAGSPKADKKDREDLLLRLAEVSVGTGRHELAEGYLRRALETNESIHGELDPSSAGILAALARVQWARHRKDKAELWLGRMRRLADSRGHNSSVGKDVLQRMARLYRDMGQPGQAARLEAQLDSGL